jgi:hypothetical protein
MNEALALHSKSPYKAGSPCYLCKIKSRESLYRMLFKVFSIIVRSNEDMVRLESIVRGLLGGEQSKKCAFMRSQEYIALRLLALYKREIISKPMVVYSEGVKVCLNPDWSVDIFMLEMGVDNDVTSVLGKRNGSDLEQEEQQQ